MRRLALLFALLPSLAFASAYSDAVTGEASILYYWPMDSCGGSGTLTASVGGVDLGSANVSCGVAGQVGNAAYFNGTNAYAQSVSDIDLTAYNHITVEYLLKADAYDNTDRVGIEFGTGAYAAGDFTFTQDNAGGLSADQLPLLSGNVGWSYAQYIKFSSGAWHHVVLDFDMSKATNEVDLYVDGVVKTPGARPSNANNTGTFGNRTLYVMARTASTLFAPGTVQHLAIYSGLDSTSIADHYNLAFNPGDAGHPVEHTFVAADFWDNGYDNVATPRQSNLARVRFTTNAGTIDVKGTTDIWATFPNSAELYTLVNGQRVATSSFTAADQETFTINLGSAGTTKEVEIVNGWQCLLGTVRGTYIDSVTIPDVWYSYNLISPVTPGDRILLYGDSIIAGLDATNASTESVAEVLRRVYGLSVMTEAWGVRALYDDRASTFATWAARMAGYSPAVIWLSIGVNDWDLETYTAANFATAYGQAVDALHAAAPGARIVCQTPIPRSVESPNANGESIGDFRDAITTACGARTFAEIVDGTGLVGLAQLTDGTHPSTAGMATMAANMYPYLAPRRNSGSLSTKVRTLSKQYRGKIR